MTYRAGRRMAPARRRVRKALVEISRLRDIRTADMPATRVRPLPRGNPRWGASWCCLHDLSMRCLDGEHVIRMAHPPVKGRR